MTVINTSPAIHLHAALPGGLGSLPGLIGGIIVPWEVGQELAAGHAKDATWQEIQSLPGILHRSQAVTVHPLLSNQIDMGEAAVIQTALDEAHDAVILDDLKARRIAITLGILLQARQTGLLPSVRVAITTLEKRGMWIAPRCRPRRSSWRVSDLENRRAQTTTTPSACSLSTASCSPAPRARPNNKRLRTSSQNFQAPTTLRLLRGLPSAARSSRAPSSAFSTRHDFVGDDAEDLVVASFALR